MPGPPGGRLSVVRAPAQAVIDLAAIRSNVAALAGHAPTAQVMAVVKADGYGHGLLPSARAALAGGATWLGVAQATEALQLRAGGLRVVPGPADRRTGAVRAGAGDAAGVGAGADQGAAGRPWRLVRARLRHVAGDGARCGPCLLYTSPSPRDGLLS